MLVLAAIGMSLVFVRNFDVGAPWQQNRFSLVGTSAILAFVAAFCFQASARLWGRFNFESVLIWVEMVGSWQTSRIGTGNNFTSRMNTENNVVRTEAMTLRVWRARIESVVFGKDDARQVTAMFSTEQEAKALAAELAAVRAQPERPGRAVQRRGRDADRRAQRRRAGDGRDRRAARGLGGADAPRAVHRRRASGGRLRQPPATPAARARAPRERFCSALRHRGAGRGAVLRQLRGAAAATGLSARHPAEQQRAMRILVIGGGVFLGAAIVDSALARGHALTVFNRGRARSDWPARRRGDRRRPQQRPRPAREDGASMPSSTPAATSRPTCARAPRRCASCGRYCFVSSISAYASFTHAPVRESDPLAASDGIAEDDRDRARHYGPQKAACERVVAAAFGERALIVRPGPHRRPGRPRPAASATGRGARSPAARSWFPT